MGIVSYVVSTSPPTYFLIFPLLQVLQDIPAGFSVFLAHLPPESFKNSLRHMDYDTDQDTKSLVLQLFLVSPN